MSYRFPVYVSAAIVVISCGLVPYVLTEEPQAFMVIELTCHVVRNQHVQQFAVNPQSAVRTRKVFGTHAPDQSLKF